jgi:hypothetical protein
VHVEVLRVLVGTDVRDHPCTTVLALDLRRDVADRHEEGAQVLSSSAVAGVKEAMCRFGTTTTWTS